MNELIVSELISQGENSSIEFKSEKVRPENVAREMTAFANTNGGTLFIGIEDDGTITGISADRLSNMEQWILNIARNNIIPSISPVFRIEEIENKKIAVVEIAKGISKPYQSIDGKYWIRVGSTNRFATKEELSRLFQQAGLVHYDISPVESTNEKDLDEIKLHDYWMTYYEINFSSLEDQDRRRLLINSDILVPHEDNFCASVGGILIFGRNPQQRLPHSSVKMAVFKGIDITDDLIDKKEIKGTITELIDSTAGLLNMFIPRSSTINGLKRDEKILIPTKVIREALVNATCHRDYSIIGRYISVYMYSDRIEITSPGKIANTLTLEKIKVGNSAIRNHFLLKYLDNMRYIDGIGRGIPMMIKFMKERVKFEELGELFRVTLFLK
jgi:ATP-dependent DNA helicase RecG